MTPLTTYPYTPMAVSGAELAARTVGSQRLIEAVAGKLVTAATSPARPHSLVVGPAGSGKSHVLRVALHRAASDPAFAARAVVVTVPQDGLDVSRFEDLTGRVLVALDPSAPLVPPGERIDRITELARDRVVVLVIENLDLVFPEIGLAGQRSLRAWVETSGQVVLVCSATRLFPGVRDRANPWFGGLATYFVNPLTNPDALSLLRWQAGGREWVAAGVAERDAGPDRDLAAFLSTTVAASRVAALNHLLGGSPRAWLLLQSRLSAAALTAGSQGEGALGEGALDVGAQDVGALGVGSQAVGALDAVLPAAAAVVEALVPQQQLQLSALSPAERRLVATLGRVGGARVGELAAAGELEQRTAAATLGRLSEAGWVRATKPLHGDRRTTYYRLRDPLLGHHLRHRAGAPAVLGLTAAVLRSYYDAMAEAGDHEPDRLRAALGGLDPRLALDRVAAEVLALLTAAAGGDEDAAMRLPGDLERLVPRLPEVTAS